MAIEEKRIYELADEQTTLTDTDLGMLDKSGYTKAKKYTMLNLFLYIFGKMFGSLIGKAYGKAFVKSDETGLEIVTLSSLPEANPVLGSDQIEVYRTSGGVSWRKAEMTSVKDYILNGVLIPNYKILVGSLSQSGISAPTLTQQENTFGVNVTWAYIGVGIYEATIPGGFVEYTSVNFISGFNGQNRIIRGGIELVDDDTIRFLVVDVDGNPQDDCFMVDFQLKVYY